MMQGERTFRDMDIALTAAMNRINDYQRVQADQQQRIDRLTEACADERREVIRLMSILGNLVDLVEGWQDGIFKCLGVTWVEPPPVMIDARAALSQAAAEETEAEFRAEYYNQPTPRQAAPEGGEET